MVDVEFDDILVSNDLDFFLPEILDVQQYNNNTELIFHKFQNPNINLSKSQVDLRPYMDILNENEYENMGSIFLAIKVAFIYDMKKYKNMEIIPRLSRKQKQYNAYLKKVRPYFNKIRHEVKDKANEMCFEIPQSTPINTIPDYLKNIQKYKPHLHFVHIERNVNQFKLSLLYGYPIIIGIKMSDLNSENTFVNTAITIIGFNNKDFIIRKYCHIMSRMDSEEYCYLPFEYIIEHCFDPCILYTLSGCKQEVNLGFIR